MYYIRKKDQEDIQRIIEEFQLETDFGQKKTPKSDKMMKFLFENYLDKLIFGVIYSPMWKYYTYGEPEDLANEARMHLFKSFTDAKFDKTRNTSLFAFLTSVVSNNIRTYTKVQNKNMNKKSNAEFDKVQFLLVTEGNYDQITDENEPSVTEKIFEILNTEFKENPKYLKLTEILRVFFMFNNNKKFYKKEFTEYAKSLTGFSNSVINGFLNKIKTFKKIKNII